MSRDIITENWIDPDDAPALKSDWFENAPAYRGDKPVRRGRPKSANTKRMISLRLDEEVVERLRAAGPGWQTRVNAALRKAVGL